MPRIAYQVQNFRGASLEIIEQANDICREYQAQGYDLTLRQLYYQFVSRAIIPNSDKSYKRLGGIVNDARLAGLLDWSYITDRTRNLASHNYGYESPAEVVEAAANSYRRELWEASGQAYRPEVWVEKEALAGIVARTCNSLYVPYFSCRGYVSQSEMWAAGRRMRRHNYEGHSPVVIHLGDHDPSGLDMTRDITERLHTFAEAPVPVLRIALNMDQIEQYNPPPNPAKLTDSRGTAYVDQYGYESWELDALEPTVLDRLIRNALEPYIDREAWEQQDAVDEVKRDRLRVIAARWEEIDSRWEDIEEVLG